MAKNYLTKEKLLAVNDLPTIELDVEEWDCTVILKTLTANQINSLTGISNSENAEEYFYKIIAMSLIDVDGKRILTNDEAKNLGDKSTPALMKIFEAIKVLNHIEDTIADKKAELEANSFLNS